MTLNIQILAGKIMEASHNAIENTYSADSMKRLINKLLAQAYLPPCETSKMEPFMKLVKG